MDICSYVHSFICTFVHITNIGKGGGFPPFAIFCYFWNVARTLLKKSSSAFALYFARCALRRSSSSLSIACTISSAWRSKAMRYSFLSSFVDISSMRLVLVVFSMFVTSFQKFFYGKLCLQSITLDSVMSSKGHYLANPHYNPYNAL